ncbi:MULTISPECIES: hypothetical protein [unclassified Nocardia]|uniref:hypothetical protein n=1 Tax=unclassified Nocardia TaxID=2637762 RepID=UPI001CE48737|nr:MULTISPECIES: hypothetical protein [unclassified Nocardia]
MTDSTGGGAGSAESNPQTSQNRPELGDPHDGHAAIGAAATVGAAVLPIGDPHTSQ